MKPTVTRADRFGLARPGIDAHTLGLSGVRQLLQACGVACVMADADVCEAFGDPERPASAAGIERWIRADRLTLLGFSYRLDPRQGADVFGRLLGVLRGRRLLAEQGGPLRAVYFAGLPQACRIVRSRRPEAAGVFQGDETPAETLAILGLPASLLPAAVAGGMAYDEARLAFGRDLVRRGGHLGVPPVERGGYGEFGTEADTLAARMAHGAAGGLPPLMRAHVGPYLPDREEAVRLFLDWSRSLAAGGLLDVLSVGTSQLTQSNFGEDWGDRPNGGGVPLNSAEEFAAVWRAARPMLVRTYAGTHNIPALARMYEETIHAAWHALSLWWFCRLDGRGPYDLAENLRQHLATLEYVAATGKPFEPNVAHHFAFRGADDVTGVVSAVLSARTAKRLGVRCLVLQTMLNTPKATWGVQDLAKARATLQLVRELRDDRFRVILQPRGGLDYFSPDLDKAKAQLAAVTALMDDIEPRDAGSPPVIHVVSYSEASHLADPPVIDESVRITRHALDEYRRLRARGLVDDMAEHPDVAARTALLVEDARTVLGAVEAAVPNPYAAEGLYRVFAAGFLPVPHLWQCRDEFPLAVRRPTAMVGGGVSVVDEQGLPVPAVERAAAASAEARRG
jgi:hypothetical protein